VAVTEARSAEGKLEEQSLLSTIGLIAGVLGLTASAFGVAIYAIDPGALSLTLINMVFAVGGVVFYAVTNWSSLTRVASGRSTPLIILEVVLLVGLLGGVGAANYFASQSNVSWDLTRDQLFTLQPQSQQVAADLSKDVKIIGFYKGVDGRRIQLEQLVELYRRHTARITLEIINPDTATPAIIEKYSMGAKSPRIVIAAEDGRHRKIVTPTEEGMTNALISVAERAARKVYFLTGHGEPSIEDIQNDTGLAKAAQDLVDEGYEVESLSLVDRENVPKDATVLVVAAAQRPLFPNEVQTIHEWLKRGGRALFLLEPGLDPGLDAVFRPYGIDVGDNLVVDSNAAAQSMGFGPDAPLVTEFEQHPITDPLKGSAVLFYWIRSVSPRVGVAKVETITLIQTSASSWGESSYATGGDVALDDADVPGPVPVAVASSMRTLLHPQKLTDESRLVVFGDTSFASNRFTTTGGNGDLFLNSVGWLAGEEARITIRPKQRGSSRIPLTEAQQYGIVFFSVNLLPLLIVGLGFSVWAIRRRK